MVISYRVGWVAASDSKDANRYRQTSARTAKLLVMGKGFNASDGVLEEDLGCLLMLACQKKVGGKKNVDR
jgi:hypothetical protein